MVHLPPPPPPNKVSLILQVRIQISTLTQETLDFSEGMKPLIVGYFLCIIGGFKYANAEEYMGYPTSRGRRKQN